MSFAIGSDAGAGAVGTFGWLGIVRSYGAQQAVICLGIDFQSGGLDEIPHGRICLSAPDSIRRTVIKSLARELALNIADELDPGLIGLVHRRRGLNSLQTRRRAGVTLKQWTGRKYGRRVRPLLHKEGICDDRKDRERRHEEADKFARITANRGREPSSTVNCGASSTGRSSRHFSSPECLRSLQFPDHAREQI